MIALYVIGSAVALIVLSVRLRGAREELARVQEEHDAYAEAVWMSLGCLLAGLAAAHWYPPPCGPAGQPGGGSRSGKPE